MVSTDPHMATSQGKLDRLYGDSREHASFALSLLADRRRAAAPRKLLSKLHLLNISTTSLCFYDRLVIWTF